MTGRLVFFTTDAGYLIPTLVAALQVEEQARVGRLADVAIFLIDIDLSVLLELQRTFPGIKFQDLERAAFELPTSASFNKTHVPRSALARLVVGERVSQTYEHLLYLDGDIQVIGDIRPLLRLEIPEGSLIAAPDVAELVWGETGIFASGFRSYLRGLGIEHGEEYFNSGVLLASRKTWIEVGAAALRFVVEHSRACRFHDQSALNKVARSRRLPLSPRFNLITAFAELGMEIAGPPVIVHFAGGEKPWSESSSDHMASFRQVYPDLVASHEFLMPFWARTAGLGDDPRPVRATRGWRRLLRSWRSTSRRHRLRKLISHRSFLLAAP